MKNWAGYFGNRKKMASIVITVLALAILLIPTYWLLSSLVEGLGTPGDESQRWEFRDPASFKTDFSVAPYRQLVVYNLAGSL